jgi:uncharacterized paraquat-inducible protein A
VLSSTNGSPSNPRLESSLTRRVVASESALNVLRCGGGARSGKRCGLLSRPASLAEPGYCRRCAAASPSSPHGRALVIAAAICFIPANTLPVLGTPTLGTSEPDTIMGGWELTANRITEV